MAEERVQRRLAAILAADVVGYSRLMGEDETGTLTALKQHRAMLLDPAIAEHRGRIVKLMGDGVLVEFASVVDAVECAVSIQRGMVERIADVPDSKRIVFRIGVNLGDVIIEGDDIYGDGVNVAARLEGLAEPGGVCISGTVFDQVKGKLDLSFDDLGPQEVKNIADPVRAYRVQLIAGDNPETPTPQRQRRRPIVITGIVVVTAALVAGGLYAWTERTQPAQPNEAAQPNNATAVAADPSDKPLLALPDKPSIAVLAFDNLSGDSEQEYFADGMAEDIITDLSKLSALFVIARNSSFQYKGQAVDVKQVGRELGVRYVLEGSVRRAKNQVRINVQLIDATTGGHLWAERYDGSLEDIFALQDEVTGRIIEALSLTLVADETTRLADHGTTNIAAHDAFLKGQELSRGTELEDLASAIGHFKRALELDPDYSRASGTLAQILYFVWRNDAGIGGRTGVKSADQAIRAAKQYARKALEKPTPAAHIAQALLLQPARRYDEAIDHAQKAIALDPNDAAGYLGLGNFLVLAGEPERAIAHFENARRLDPHNVEKIDQGLGLAYFGMDRFDDAARFLERARDAAPGNNLNWMYLAATYGHLGRVDDAAAAVERMNALRRAQGLNVFRTFTLFVWYFNEKSDENRLKEGLIKAGVPQDF
jgi:TolB-like protein/class 3 adenylate cyclase/Tfp pilus assembly protein PilF